MVRILVFLALFSNVATYAQALKLSNDAQISAVTLGPTQVELYSAFGHSAFRVSDPLAGLDVIFDYGVFDFHQPNFYLNFTRGHLNYQLGVHGYAPFRDHYIEHNRYIHEQVLNLTLDQKQKVFDYLEWNSRPENMHYYYDYFYDNCATRIRDVLVKALPGAITFDGSYIKTNYTIRQLTDIYLKQQPWGDLGIDICLGLPMDKKASPMEYMFLPDYIEAGFNHATIKNDSAIVPLVKETISVYDQREMDPEWSLPNPAYFFSFFAAIAIGLSLLDIKRKKLTNWFDAIVLSLVGLIGLLLTVLWLFTDHKAAANNMNVIWALPTHLVAVVAFVRKPSWLKKYFMIVTVINLILLASWAFLPQLLHYALIPMVIALTARSFVQYKLR